MTRTRELWLAIPHLRAFGAMLPPEARYACLERALARATAGYGQPSGTEAVLMGLCGAQHSAAEPPVAPLTALADGLDVGDHHWIRADPAWVQADMAQVLMRGHGALAIDEQERAELAESLREHFAADGLEFHAPAAERWYVQSASPVEVRASPPERVLGTNLLDQLPGGDEGRRWRWHLNEAQILLRHHPVNRRREAAGRVPVNSLWLWGAGRLPAPAVSSVDAISGGDALGRGLAAHLGLKWSPLPASAESLLGHADRVLAVVAIDAAGPQQALETLERDWLAPAVAALRGGRLGTLRWVDTESGRCWRLERAHWARVWRRQRRLRRILGDD